MFLLVNNSVQSSSHAEGKDLLTSSRSWFWACTLLLILLCQGACCLSAIDPPNASESDAWLVASKAGSEELAVTAAAVLSVSPSLSPQLSSPPGPRRSGKAGDSTRQFIAITAAAPTSTSLAQAIVGGKGSTASGKVRVASGQQQRHGQVPVTQGKAASGSERLAALPLVATATGLTMGLSSVGTTKPANHSRAIWEQEFTSPLFHEDAYTITDLAIHSEMPNMTIAAAEGMSEYFNLSTPLANFGLDTVPLPVGISWQAENDSEVEIKDLLYNMCQDFNLSQLVPATCNNRTQCVLDVGQQLEAIRSRQAAGGIAVLLQQYDCRPEFNYSNAANCSKCEVSYNRWLCSTGLTVYMHMENSSVVVNPCADICDAVVKDCPYIPPQADTSPAVEPCFLCRDKLIEDSLNSNERCYNFSTLPVQITVRVLGSSAATSITVTTGRHWWHLNAVILSAAITGLFK